MPTLRVHAGPYSRHHCPIVATVPGLAGRAVALVQEPGGRPRGCQWLSEDQLAWMLVRLEAGSTQDYRLEIASQRRAPAARLKWEALALDRLQLNLDGTAMASAELASSTRFPGITALHGCGNPLAPWSVEGIRIAPDLPGRHRQHTRITLLEQPVDGTVTARLATRAFWRDELDRAILEELCTWHFHATPRDLRLADLTLQLRASAGPVEFSGTPGSGLLHVPLPGTLVNDPACVVTNSLGTLGTDSLARTRPSWVHLSAPTGGLAVLEHLENPGAPSPWRIDFTGELSNDPFCLPGEFDRLLDPLTLRLAAGESLIFRYRFLLHGPEYPAERIRGHFLDWIEPPRVELIP